MGNGNGNRSPALANFMQVGVRVDEWSRADGPPVGSRFGGWERHSTLSERDLVWLGIMARALDSRDIAGALRADFDAPQWSARKLPFHSPFVCDAFSF